MKERDIEKYLVDRVKALGGEVRKVQWIGRVGAPDRLVMLPGGRVRMSSHSFLDTLMPSPPLSTWVELKAPGEKPRTSQLREHARMRAMGQHVVVIDSIEGVDELLS